MAVPDEVELVIQSKIVRDAAHEVALSFITNNPLAAVIVFQIIRNRSHVLEK